MPRAPTPIEQKIIDRVSGHIEYSGLSARQIAKLTDWSLKRVQRLLSGDTQLSAADMLVLSDVLGKPVGELFPPQFKRRAA